ncbi:unnamed protein product [Linum tenue]|uniref:Pentatricopeptide repeat-containing protein n=1 Tax=Linum tenue TaxID=586396 RepID=A0AAV0RQ95_9ROSI|nr:unnamed protein product [Linum tenue]
MVLLEDPISQEKHYLEMRKNATIEKASKSISTLSLEVGSLAGTFHGAYFSLNNGKAKRTNDVCWNYSLVLYCELCNMVKNSKNNVLPFPNITKLRMSLLIIACTAIDKMYLKEGRSLLLSLRNSKKSLPFVLNTNPHHNLDPQYERSHPLLKESQVLTRLENEPSISIALDYFKSIANSKAFRHTALTYRTMIRRLGDEGNVDGIQYLLHQMKLEGLHCNPDLFVNSEV